MIKDENHLTKALTKREDGLITRGNKRRGPSTLRKTGKQETSKEIEIEEVLKGETGKMIKEEKGRGKTIERIEIGMGGVIEAEKGEEIIEAEMSQGEEETQEAEVVHIKKGDDETLNKFENLINCKL